MSEKSICVWTLDMADCGVYDTDCGNTFEVECGTPSENGMKFCCYCGKPIYEDLEAADNDDWEDGDKPATRPFPE